MNAIFYALDRWGPSRFQDQTRASNSSPPIVCFAKTKQGYCETCKTWKPAPKKRNKGWACTDCVEVARLAKLADAGDLKSPDESRAGSSPAPGTTQTESE